MKHYETGIMAVFHSTGIAPARLIVDD